MTNQQINNSLLSITSKLSIWIKERICKPQHWRNLLFFRDKINKNPWIKFCPISPSILVKYPVLPLISNGLYFLMQAAVPTGVWGEGQSGGRLTLPSETCLYHTSMRSRVSSAHNGQPSTKPIVYSIRVFTMVFLWEDDIFFFSY